MSTAMKCDELSDRETVQLCRQVATLVLERLRAMVAEAGSADLPLRELIGDLAREMELHLQEIRRLGGRAGIPEGSGDESGSRIARSFLPSLTKSAGDRPLDRESGIYLSECLGQDVASFYGALIPRASDEPSRLFFARSKRSIERRLIFLRRVILKDARPPEPKPSRGNGA